MQTETRDYGYLIRTGANVAASPAQLPLSMQPEKVTVRLRGYPHAGLWETRFEGRWRAVHMQVHRTFIVYRGERITIQIDGV